VIVMPCEGCKHLSDVLYVKTRDGDFIHACVRDWENDDEIGGDCYTYPEGRL
jgi:hypothetical protein